MSPTIRLRTIWASSLSRALPGALSGALSDAGRAQLAAERAEAAGRPASGEWLAAAEEWDSAGRPYETAVAQVRAAEALLSGAGGRGPATEVLAAASEKADRLGATPLAREVADLARAARLSVPEPRPTPTPERPVRRLGLTDREEQVLVLIAQGRTNREIGEVLYMSPKTASVHVTRILQKLGVTSRVQAAAVAARSGLASYEVGR